MKLALALLLLVAPAAPAGPQMRDNRDSELSCNGIDRDRPMVCEIRETTLGPSGSLEIEAGRNGGVTVKGWAQNSVLVRARVEAWADSEADARNVVSQIRVDAEGGRIRAAGPEFGGFFQWNDDRRWAVSFEVFAPWNTGLRISSHNGGLEISDMRGRIEFQSHNGGVQLARLAGDVTGESHNGGIEIELNGNAWDGRQLDVSSHNGAITLSAPASFSARVEAHTHHGGIDSDFPINLNGRIAQNDLNFNIGAGGPPIKITTHNGAIRLHRR